jgi:hypothetical protein
MQMSHNKKWVIYFVWSIWCEIFVQACSTAPRVITIPAASENKLPSLRIGGDYGEALAAMMTFMVRDLGLPQLEGVVWFYPTRAAFESALAADYLNDVQQVEKQFGPKGKAAFEQNLEARAAQTAASFIAVGKYRRVLVNEWYFMRLPWWESIRVLAHELTHTAQSELVDGKFTAADRWLVEGFADWVSYKFLDSLNLDDFSKSRERNIDLIASARQFQTFPSLAQLASGPNWQTWNRTLGHGATYGQAFIAVDLLVEQKGLRAVIEYFRLFKKLNNRDRNFVIAFGEPLSAFEEKFNAHLHGLVGK